MTTRRRVLLAAALLAVLPPLAAEPSANAPPPPDLGTEQDVQSYGQPAAPAPSAPSAEQDKAAVSQPGSELEQPDLPEPVQSGEKMEPDITIIKREKETIQEYRVNGQLRMVKVIPAVGPPYYLLDTDGDGNVDVRRDNLESGLKTHQWTLFSW